jgi:hypothetical protein
VPFAVLAHAGDAEADLLARTLAGRGRSPVVLLDAEELLLGSKFVHRLDEQGVATEIEVPGAAPLSSEALEGVVCRLTHAPVPHFERAPEADRRYATMEAHALLISWLAGLDCPVLNPVTSRGLAGPNVGLPELSTLAAACGLRSRRFDLDSRRGPEPWLEPLAASPREALVAGEQVLGPLDEETAAACVELARRLGCPVLGVHLAPALHGGEQLLCGVDPLPRLGAEGARAVAELLVGMAA